MAVNRIPISQLKEGDVLLYHGNGLISSLIRLFDGTEYSHAAIYTGSKVLEAIGSGIEERDVAASVAGAEYVHVYRFISASREPLGPPNFPVDPVRGRMQYYLANRQRYAYEAILLLAILASTRRVKVPGVSWLLRNVLDLAMKLVSSLTAMGREPMICSELVYRCFDEAEAAKYRILIRGADTIMSASAMTVRGVPGGSAIFAAQASEDPMETLALEEDAAAFLNLFTAAKRQPLQDVDGLPSFSAAAVADFVTPGDLKKSPNLALQGQLIINP